MEIVGFSLHQQNSHDRLSEPRQCLLPTNEVSTAINLQYLPWIYFSLHSAFLCFRLNHITSSALLRVLGSIGNWSKASALFEELGTRNAGNLDPFSFTATSDACVETAQWTQTLGLLERTSSTSIEMGLQKISLANIAIGATGVATLWSTALKLFSAELGVQRTSITYNAAVSSLGQSARWQLALMLLKQLEDQLAHGNDITFTAVINACERAEAATEMPSSRMPRVKSSIHDSLCESPRRNALSSLRALSCPSKNCMIYTVYLSI